MTIVYHRVQTSVALDNVLRCSILKLTGCYQKKTMRPFPLCSCREWAQRRLWGYRFLAVQNQTGQTSIGPRQIPPSADLGMACAAARVSPTALGGDMEPKAISQTKKNELADDTLEGASAIAEFLFGSRDKTRKVYHLVQTSKIPIYRLGALLHARKSVLLEFIAAQERRVMLEDTESAVPSEATLTPASPTSPGNTELKEVTKCSKRPIFGFRSVLRERKSALLKFITGQENRVLPPEA